MYVPKNLKLNKFRVVQIPSARDIINRYGFCPGNNYSGEDMSPNPNMTKLDLALQLDAENGNKLAAERAAASE